MPSPDKQALTPKSLKEASQLAIAGNWVDISALVPVVDGEFQRQQTAFQAGVQRAFDILTETGKSAEYAQFLKIVEPELKHITGLEVASDLEFVLVFRCDNEMYSDYEKNPRYIYLLDPYINQIYRTLIKRRNKFMFWTGAMRWVLREIQAVLPDDLAGVPVVCREDFQQIIGIFLKRLKKEISERAAKQQLRSVYPKFSERAYVSGLSLLAQYDFLHELTPQQQMNFAGRNKFPILFADPARGVFIDDNHDYIKTAVAAFWPEQRTIEVDPGYFSLRRAREMMDGFRRIAPA